MLGTARRNLRDMFEHNRMIKDRSVAEMLRYILHSLLSIDDTLFICSTHISHLLCHCHSIRGEMDLDEAMNLFKTRPHIQAVMLKGHGEKPEPGRTPFLSKFFRGE
jgi:hypothetical protein